MEPGETRGGNEAEASARPRHRTLLGLDIDPLWFFSCLIAAGFFSAAAVLPLWVMKLTAPQYPEGLAVTAYGTHMIGDLHEVNSLNHYIGAMVIQPESISELVLFPYALGAIIGALLLASVVRCPPGLRLLLSLGVWGFPIGLLVDLQWWLYRFGHELARDAPMRALVPNGFTPAVLGHTHVINFDTTTGVQIGFWMMVAGALTPGVPWAFRFLRDSWRNTSMPAAALVLVIVLALVHPDAASAAPVASIMDMIARAAPGSIVEVPAGTYHEHLRIDKPLTLRGVGSPVIDGDGQGDVITVTAEDVTLRGFVVQGSGRDVADEPAGIRLVANRATIEGNQLRDVLYGISLVESGGHRVLDNEISSILGYPPERRGHAIYLWYTDGNLIQGNRIDGAKDGIFVGFASHIHIQANSVVRSRYGVHYMYSQDNTITGNTFIDNIAGAAIMFSQRIVLRDNTFSGSRSPASGFGVLLKDVDDLDMTGNRVDHNRLGITMEGAPLAPSASVTLRDNLVGFNQVGLELATNTAATFTGNSFVGNLEQLRATGGGAPVRDRWSEAGRGNYWDDYRGYDATGDGVGDIPFRYGGTYEELIQHDEALRAYSFTSARAALELASRWFPVFRSDPLVVDPAPLMSSTVSLRPTAGAAVRVSAALAMASMAVISTLVLVALGRGGAWRRS